MVVFESLLTCFQLNPSARLDFDCVVGLLSARRLGSVWLPNTEKDPRGRTTVGTAIRAGRTNEIRTKSFKRRIEDSCLGTTYHSKPTASNRFSAAKADDREDSNPSSRSGSVHDNKRSREWFFLQIGDGLSTLASVTGLGFKDSDNWLPEEKVCQTVFSSYW